MLLDALPEPTPIAQLSGREGELRYVTQNFRDLQTLKALPFCAGGLLSVEILPQRHLSIAVVMMMGSAVLVLGWVCAAWLERWYKERYGFVSATKIQPEQVPGAGPITWLSFALILILFISTSTRDSWFYVLYAQLISFLLSRCLHACPQSAPIRLRQVLYIGTTLAAVGAIVYVAICPGFRWHAVETWFGSIAVLSLYDHWLLSYLLRPRGLQISEGRHE